MQASVFRNPVIPGFAPDPSVVYVDDVFDLVTSSFHIWPGLPVYASTDLQSWALLGELHLSLSDDEGHEQIKLIAGKETLSSQTGRISFVGQRQRALEAIATTQLTLSANLGSCRAGIAMYLDAFRHVSLSSNFESQEIELAQKTVTNDSESRTRFLPVGDIHAIEMSIMTSKAGYEFSYRPVAAKGKGSAQSLAAWSTIGRVTARDLAARDFTGPLMGVFAIDTSGVESGQQITFRDFAVAAL